MTKLALVLMSGGDLLDMVCHEMTLFGIDLVIQFTFGHSDELCHYVSELYLMIPPNGHTELKEVHFCKTAGTAVGQTHKIVREEQGLLQRDQIFIAFTSL